jgi:hypothetical protein
MKKFLFLTLSVLFANIFFSQTKAIPARKKPVSQLELTYVAARLNLMGEMNYHFTNAKGKIIEFCCLDSANTELKKIFESPTLSGNENDNDYIVKESVGKKFIVRFKTVTKMEKGPGKSKRAVPYRTILTAVEMK